MTATLDDVAKKSKREPTAEEKVAEELVRRAGEQGLSLTGPDGLLKQLTKTVLETALNQELTEHLGHDKHGLAGNETGNVRNGTRPKTVLTEGSGQVQVDVPRDRGGTFEPQIVKKRQRRLSGGDEMVLSLYAKGLITVVTYWSPISRNLRRGNTNVTQSHGAAHQPARAPGGRSGCRPASDRARPSHPSRSLGRRGLRW
jgi:hypothetical protein